MAKAPKKTKKSATATKAAKAKTPRSTPQKIETPKRNPMMVPFAIGAVLVGVVLGMMLNTGGKQNMSEADFEAKMEAYVNENAGTILDALNKYMFKQAENEKKQLLNLVRADDGKTIFGNPEGDITIYEFADYNCGYCKRAYNDIMAAVKEDGNIRVVVKELPILSPSSVVAAKLSMAAAELGKFEELHTAMMQWQGKLDDAAFAQITSELGLSKDELTNIISKSDIEETLKKNQAIAEQLQISGTPGFVIGSEIVPGYIPKEEILAIVRNERKRS